MNLALLLQSAVQANPDNTAITQGERSASYSEVWTRVLSLAQGLTSLGLVKGDRVAIFMDNCPEYLESFFAIFSQGLCVVPMNSQFTADEVDYHLQDSGARAIIFNTRLRSVVQEAFHQHAHVPHCIEVSDTFSGNGATIHYQALISAHKDEPAVIVDVGPEELAWLFYTSGTTGRPKGAMLTTANVVAVVVGWIADLIHLDQESVTLHTAPLSHGAGFHALSSMSRSGHQILMETGRFDAEMFLSTVQRHSVTDTWMVPTQINRIVRSENFEPMRISTLQHIVYGGAPFPIRDLIHALQTLGPILIQIYGQGETPMTATVLTANEHAHALNNDQSILGSAGRVRLGMEVETFNANGESTPPGTPGEIAVRGPTVMSGYWGNAQASAHTLRNGWLHTGDIGVFDDQGYLSIVDRLKDMIISGGSNVYAREVESVILTLPGMIAVAVVGLPDAEWGERVVAAVVASHEASLTEDDVIAHCRLSLAGYKIPKRVDFLAGLPLTTYGKVSKREVKELLASHDTPATS